MKFKVAFSRNPRLLPLINGNVTIDGIEFDWESGEPGELFLRQLKENRYDLFEFSISDFLVISSRADWAHLKWTAIPTFLSKPVHLFLNLWGHEDSGITTYADLRGKRLAVPDYGMTAGVWLRIMLRKMYGIEAREIAWYNGRPPSSRHGRLLGIDSRTAPEVSLINLSEEPSMNDMLHAGELDAAIGAPFGAPIVPGPTIRNVSTPEVVERLLGDFYQTEGVTPVNHVLCLKHQHAVADPTLPRRIWEAFERSKQTSYDLARKYAEAYLVLPATSFERQAQLIGSDPYPSGLSANRHMLGLVAEQLVLDGFIPHVPNFDELFAESLRQT